MRLLQMSFSGAALILAIAILRALAIHRLPKKTFFALWGVVLIRLLCPFTIPSPYSAYTLAETLLPTRNGLAAQTPGMALLPEALPAVPALSPAAEAPHTLSLWMILWLAGALTCALFFLVSGIRCSREFRTSLPAGSAYTQRWLEAHPLRRTIEIRQSDRIAAPLTYGVLHPVILMPKTIDWTDEASLHYILTHEYVHIQRFDTATKRIAAAALCLHWFNPLVWVMYFLLNRDMELACDESVVRRTGEQRRASYAHMLIRMEAKKSGLLPFCSNFSKNATEERIRAIMTMKKTTAGAAAISVMVILILAVLFATSRDSGSPQPVVPETPDMDHAAALIKAVSEDSITVDPVEFITREDTERIRELNLQEYDMPDGYYILNEKPETVVWKCDKNTVFTFIDWHAHFTGLKHPEEYTTTDIREFEFYIRHDYNDGEDFNYSPRLPFFFTSRNGAIQKVLEIPIA